MIIGILGQISSGKGTVGDYLVSKHGFIKESFAGPVKDCVAAIFGWPRHLLEGDTEESRTFRETVDPIWSMRLGFNVTPRWALQKMGTEAGRYGIHEDIWVESFKQRISLSIKKDFVITDTRFPNEIMAINQIGGYIIEVVRGLPKDWEEEATKINRGYAWNIPLGVNDIPVHYSEWAYLGYPYVGSRITNDGTLEELYNKVDLILGGLV